jgi:two-component system phosphate regulon response regulator OmpR
MATDRFLIIDDDVRLADMLREYLAMSGAVVEARPSGQGGLDAVGQAARTGAPYDAVILDVMLPDLDGFENLPKPFNPRELLARLKAILRRRRDPAAGAPSVLRFGRLEIDEGSRCVRVDGEARSVTSYQFDLLLTLARNAGRVMSRERLMDLARGEELEAFDRSIDVHISRLRAALEDAPAHPRRIITVRGAGYVFARAQDQD